MLSDAILAFTATGGAGLAWAGAGALLERIDRRWPRALRPYVGAHRPGRATLDLPASHFDHVCELGAYGVCTACGYELGEPPVYYLPVHDEYCDCAACVDAWLDSRELANDAWLEGIG